MLVSYCVIYMPIQFIKLTYSAPTALCLYRRRK